MGSGLSISSNLILYMQMCLTIYSFQDWTFIQACIEVVGSDCHFTNSVKVSLEKDLQKQVHEWVYEHVSFFIRMLKYLPVTFPSVYVQHWGSGIITMQGRGNNRHAEAPGLFIYLINLFIHRCIHCLGHFFLLRPLFPPPPFFQVDPILPFSQVLLKRRPKQ
jgi:hypothetical protein